MATPGPRTKSPIRKVVKIYSINQQNSIKVLLPFKIDELKNVGFDVDANSANAGTVETGQVICWCGAYVKVFLESHELTKDLEAKIYFSISGATRHKNVVHKVSSFF